MEKLPRKEQQELLDKIRIMNDQAESLANLSLLTSLINVEVTGCELAELTLCNDLHDILKRLGFSDSKPESISLNLIYDQLKQVFSASNIIYNFKECYFEFSQTPSMKQQYNDCYYFQIISGNKIIQAKDDSFIIPALKIKQLLKESGVKLPQDPHPASWDEIDKILQFACAWKSEAQAIRMIDERTTLLINDSKNGGYKDLCKDSYVREITIAEQFSNNPLELPKAAVEFVFRTRKPSKKPTLTSVSLVPLTHEIDYDIEHPIRKPENSKRHEINLKENDVFPDLFEAMNSYYNNMIFGV